MRKLATFEGIVENGRVTLLSDAGIPEQTRVYVLVPAAGTVSAQYVASPHLADPEQARDFEKQVIEDAIKTDV
jgi:hypothetical protein